MLNPDFNFVYWIGGFFAITIIIFFARKYFAILGHIWEILKLVFNYFYVVLIPIPIIYLMYYYLFFDEAKQDTYIFNSIDLIKDLKNLSFWFFTAGAFSAATKIISNLKIFKNQFEEIILSEKFSAKFKEILLSNEFENQLTKNFEILTFSQENLNKQPNLDKIWKNVTLCKYEKHFPQLMEKLREKIENDLFAENNLSYYYKNLRLQIKFELLENDIVKITETSTSTLISNTDDEIDIEFFVTSHENDSDNIYTKIIPSKTKINGEAFDEDFFNDSNPIKEGEYFKKIFKHQLVGKKEYHIDRCIEMKQKLHEDRMYSFSSSKIIDDIYINLVTCDKLNIFFSPVDKNVFVKDNIDFAGTNFANRDVLMPGEKFKVFIFKKN
ncbi:hypothetical protein [Empedobacter stercoris]|uniref:hypothetical protein n=1 Tax=Empedobacter stercoris TaxID=1628248 RepID=UPI0039EA2176